jgi:UDP-N-acetylglucosamine--N-acetylmuramyl-(pentapeptide) pyrophosphoryl-undecaprenol N-acetylglucosamine transferase
MAEQARIPFHSISTGKWRRYFSVQNLLDLFRLPWGMLQARRLLKKLQPDLVFASGGFVSAPVLWAARSLGIATALYDLDALPSLTTRFFAPRVSQLFLGFQAVSLEWS